MDLTDKGKQHLPGISPLVDEPNSSFILSLSTTIDLVEITATALIIEDLVGILPTCLFFKLRCL